MAANLFQESIHWYSSCGIDFSIWWLVYAFAYPDFKLPPIALLTVPRLQAVTVERTYWGKIAVSVASCRILTWGVLVSGDRD